MQLPPIFDVRKLGRFFSRELPQNQINNANGQIQYVKEHGMIEEHEEPAFAQEVAPRRIKKGPPENRAIPRIRQALRYV
jgi:hypothetical protein